MAAAATTAWAAPARTRPAFDHLVMDSRYATSPGRVRIRTGRIATLEKTLPEYPSAHQTSLLTAAGVPVAQINHVGGALGYPQVLGRAMVEQVHHPEAGTLRRNLLLRLGGRRGWRDAG